MIAAIEKDHLVYVTSRDTNNILTVSSPVEATRNRALTFDLIGLDVGNDNPTFAALESSYLEDITVTSSSSTAQKELVFYEYDLGINTLVRKWSHIVSNTAHVLIPIPHGGVLVCSTTQISYHRPVAAVAAATTSNNPISVPIPLRKADSSHNNNNNTGSFIITHTEFRFRKDVFFSFIQTERGDLFKISIDFDASKDNKVTDIHLQYFDTITPAMKLLISRRGFLFAAAESGYNVPLILVVYTLTRSNNKEKHHIL
jgi:splicing factor 3B subunit 3